ncbi:MAG: hypothetical protein EB015_22670, partial [Methylocystaceae bacterium]|nr:hypothetical protein [Methylocystaceae bacterium]
RSAIEKVLNSVVTILSDTGSGSGFFVSASGHIVTNYHVIDGTNKITVHFKSGRQAKADLIDFSLNRDIALLQIREASTPLTFGDPALASVGTDVFAVGSPGGANGILEHTVTRGIISGHRRLPSETNASVEVDLIQTDTDLNVINTKTVDLYAATNPDNAIGRIRATRLPDTNTTIFGFQVGSTLHLVEMDAKGNIAQDYTQTLGTNIIFDRLTGLNDGRIEISLLTKGATYSAATLVQTQIFDTRTAALNVSGGTGLVAGTSLADTIAMASSNAVVEGGAGADKLSATGKNSTLSYEHSNAAVQINLSKKTAAGGDAAGDTISGFSNVIGSQFADNLTGDANANIFTGGIGNDSIIGGG